MRFHADVIDIVQPFVGRKRRVQPSDKIMHDLHIDGDDAAEMLTLIVRRFGTDISNLRFGEYFHGETEAFPAYLLELVCTLFKHRTKTKKPFSVKHLCSVVDTGVWFDP